MITEFSKITGVPIDAILGRCRNENIAIHRAVYYRLLYEAGFSYPQIGKLNSRTHATILRAVKMVENALFVGDKNIKQIVDKTEHLKIDYMINLKQILELRPPERLGEKEQTREVLFPRCCYCNGKGWFYYNGKHKKDVKEPNYTPCPYCNGTGKVKAVVVVSWVPDGDVKEVKEDNEF